MPLSGSEGWTVQSIDWSLHTSVWCTNTQVRPSNKHSVVCSAQTHLCAIGAAGTAAIGAGCCVSASCCDVTEMFCLVSILQVMTQSFKCNAFVSYLRTVLGVLWGTRWRTWLRHRATTRKVAGSIPDVVIGIFR